MAGSSEPTAAVSAKTKMAPPAAPATVTATTVSATSIRVAWSRVNNASSYRIAWSTTTSGSFDSTKTVNDTLDTVKTLAANTTYYFKVLALNAGGASGYSSQIGSATTLPLPPAAPDSVRATPLSSRSLQILWKASAGTDRYVILRGSTATGNFSPIDSVNAPAVTYTMGDLTPSTMYYVRIRAVNRGEVVPFLQSAQHKPQPLSCKHLLYLPG